MIPIPAINIPRPVLIGLGVVALLAIVFFLGRCSGGDDSAQQQAQQTTRSSEALAGAAKDAISTLEGRVVTERAIDAAVAEATQEIHDAKDADAVRDAVLARLCQQASHSHDPACQVFNTAP